MNGTTPGKKLYMIISAASIRINLSPVNGWNERISWERLERTCLARTVGKVL